MKIFILVDDMSGTGPVFLNIIWPQINAISECVETEILSIPPLGDVRSSWGKRVSEFHKRRSYGSALDKRVRESLDPNGPNILIVRTAGSRNAHWAQVLSSNWAAFDRRVLNVCDTLKPEHLRNAIYQKFDVLCFPCADQARTFEEETGVSTLVLAAHSDVLNSHSTGAFRPIDMILVGRRDKDLNDPIYRHYLDPASQRLFLDFATRPQARAPCEEEFASLMAAYARSSISFCYEASGIPRFRGRSPLLSRWVHAWAAGCTVLGTRPHGTGAASLFDWHDAIIDLPRDPREAIDLIEGILDDRAGLARRRIRNVTECLERHDTRYRLRLLLESLGLPIPTPLENRIAKLNARANELRTEYAAELVKD